MRGLEKPFFINNRASLDALAKALHRVDYKCWSVGLRTKAGKHFIGLSWDYKPNSDYSKKWDKRGIIVFNSFQAYEDLHDDVVKILNEKHKTTEAEAA